MSGWPPGPANSLTDIAGVAVGQAQDSEAASGVTAVVTPGRAVAGGDVRGGAPGTRETDLLAPANLVEAVDAVVLAGGSAFGLAAADGAMQALAEQGRGLDAAGFTVPIVPAAILFDRFAAGWARPDRGPEALPRADYAALGARAVAVATTDDACALGTVGAGYGATAGGYKGGLGSASAQDPAGGPAVAALVAANPWGSPVIPGTRHLWGWWAEQAGELGGLGPPPAMPDWRADRLAPPLDPAPSGREATTLAVIATSADLTPAESRHLAVMAADGVSRAIRPAHSPFDGDATFALATGRAALPAPRPGSLARLGSAAADTLTRAIGRAVINAQPLPGGPPALRAS